jgi:hypothetical protein
MRAKAAELKMFLCSTGKFVFVLKQGSLAININLFFNVLR